MKKIVARIGGGLGNQMFQCAHARFMADTTGRPLVIDTSTLILDVVSCLAHRDFRFYRHYDLRSFAGPAQERHVIFPKRVLYAILWVIMRQTGPTIRRQVQKAFGVIWSNIFGCLQTISHLPRLGRTAQYDILCSGVPLDIPILPERAWLRKYFTFPKFNSVEHVNLAKTIGDGEGWCSVHIRRSDYVLFGGDIDKTYHYKAIEHMKANTKISHWLFFSDDIEWSKANFSDIPNATFFAGNYKHPVEDMRFMSLCKNHIIANSTFSWWGAYLAQDAGTTIYPASWYSLEAAKTRFPTNWIAL